MPVHIIFGDERDVDAIAASRRVGDEEAREQGVINDYCLYFDFAQYKLPFDS
jgi:hypothetical protein